MTTGPYTTKEKDFIDIHWRGMGDKQLAEKLGRHPRGIEQVRRHMGLHRLMSKKERGALPVRTAAEFAGCMASTNWTHIYLALEQRRKDILACWIRCEQQKAQPRDYDHERCQERLGWLYRDIVRTIRRTVELASASIDQQLAA